jgi:hypothetical protein
VRLVPWCGALLLVLIQAGCGHDKPFQPDSFDQDSTRTRGSMRQLTYNLGADRAPRWLPGDSGLLYSMERLDTPSRHRCLAWMPASGGTVSRIDCKNFGQSIDSTYSFEWPAVHPGGMVSFLLVANRITAVRPGYQTLRLGRIDDPGNAPELLLLPYRVDTSFYNTIISPHWVDSSRMIFVAGMMLVGEYPIPPDTFFGGRVAATLTRQAGGSVVAGIPGTENASSVAANPGADEFFFTVMGDARVYRSDLAGTNIRVHYDFGPGQVARDVAIRGDSLLVVVGNRTVLQEFTEVGTYQSDFGDRLRLIHVASGLDQAVGDAPVCYRRPAFSPAGQTLLVEGFATADTACTSTAIASPEGNIWLLDLP